MMRNKTALAYKIFDMEKNSIPEIANVDDVYQDGRINFSKLANTFEFLNTDYLRESLKLIEEFTGLPLVIHVGLAGAGPTVYMILKDDFKIVLDDKFQIIKTKQLT